MAEHNPTSSLFAPLDTFVERHIGPSADEVQAMLKALELDSLDALVHSVIPQSIQRNEPLSLGAPRGEHELLQELKGIASQNKVFRSMIGMGYSNCITPPVIQRNILENPGWYTQYTPYQAEISQGRMEALINFQTMVVDLTGLPLANASMLDEATAAAEAMAMCFAIHRNKRKGFVVSKHCHPQTIAVVQTRSKPLDIELFIEDDLSDFDFEGNNVAGVLLQYPDTHGRIEDYGAIIEKAKAAKTTVVMAADLLSLTMLKSPGEWGADIAVGSTQRFGIPLGFGGPHAAYLSTQEQHKRQVPGRLIGVSRDATGKPGYRLALQTREQHIRRDRATSNICTSQVLLAIMAGMYAVYHGPQGLRRIAEQIHGKTCVLAEGLKQLGYTLEDAPFFDTLLVQTDQSQQGNLQALALKSEINLRYFDNGHIGISLDESTTRDDLEALFAIFGGGNDTNVDVDTLAGQIDASYSETFTRTSDYLTHEVFHRYHSEHEMLRYIHRLQGRDLSLAHSMIPLGSCTMKLNGTSEMLPVTWPEFGALHPFAPADQTQGYKVLFDTLSTWLAEITGFDGVSLQPNAGSQGEYAGLLVIRAYHESRSEGHRNICLIPTSAHGTNPASAVMAGFKVVPIACDDRGDIDLEDLEAKAKQHADNLGALMVTYPSTHGVFEEGIKQVCEIIHANGGQVYMDGANMNAQVGLCRPGDFGADVCHLNLHKTFCIPHGGGGPGMGPIATVAHLTPFLPGHPLVELGQSEAIGPVSAAPYGSPSILPISWVYIALMGEAGLKQATQVAILNANYMASRLKEHYDILYTGNNDRVAHEFVLDLRPFKANGVEVVDVAKRLMDFGFHAPTMSWPVPGTLMVEPTESESKAELDRFCDAMIAIRQEIQDVMDGKIAADNSPLHNAPHTQDVVMADNWDRPYTREQAAYPAPWVRAHKFWPHVGRVDDAHGDRHLYCTCPPMEDYA